MRKSLSSLSQVTLDQIVTEKAKRSLSEYIKCTWPIIEPATEYKHNWHIDAISEHLEAVTLGQIKRLLINMPPRYMKSICVSVMWPTWEWIKFPSTRWLFASYAASLSTKHSLDRRTIIQSPWYQQRFGNIYTLSDDQNIKTEYNNNKRGYMFATSTGGTATGKGGDRIVVDDPLNPKEAGSDALRNMANTFFDQTLTTRLDDKKKGAIVIVMQRLHEKDLSGHVLDQGGYVHLNLPAEASKKTMIHFPISGKTMEREQGHIIWEAREGKEELEQQKRALGSYGYAGQYQQDPSPADGGLLKRTWWKYYDEMPPLHTFDTILISVDCSFKDLESSDFVVMQVWGRIGAKKYLLDQARKKMTFPETVKRLKALVAKWPQARAKLIEDKANGSAVIQTVKDTIDGIIPVEPQGGKIARAQAVSYTIEAGDVYLPSKEIAIWVDDFVEECAKFPKGANDDQVDAMTQALVRLIEEEFVPWSEHVPWL